MTKVAATRPPGRYAFAFVVLAVTLNMLCFGLFMPVMPALLSELSGAPVDQAMRHNGWMAMADAASNFLAMPLAAESRLLHSHRRRRPARPCRLSGHLEHLRRRAYGWTASEVGVSLGAVGIGVNRRAVATGAAGAG